MAVEATHRRRFLRMAAGGVVGLGAVGVASRLALHPDGDGSGTGGLLRLSSGDGSDVGSLEVPLGDDLLPQTARRAWGSTRLPTSAHSMVGFTWSEHAAPPHVRINSKIEGHWQGWRDVPILHDLPDPDSGEGRGLVGTELAWVGHSDGIQIEVSGHRPDDLTLVLLHPAPRSADLAAGRFGSSDLLHRTDVVTAKPALLSRRDWGADESWRNGSPRYCSTIQQAHVHHTVNANDYSADDVPALLRGIYRYHTHNLGWSDIAYNFLVDRFGRAWVGRAGGAKKAVRGAHTLGFNATSTGISVIGNFDLVTPAPAVLTAIEQIAAWKLSMYDRDPTGTTSVVSEGSDKFKAGRTVSLPVIDGHRDTNDTACPGQHLYDALPTIRAGTKAIVVGAQIKPIAITQAARVAGDSVVGQKLIVRGSQTNPPDATAAYTWSRNGVPIPGATTRSYLITAADAGASLAVRVDHSKSGYLTVSETAAAPAPVMVSTSTAIRVRGRHLKAQVKVSVSPHGVTTPATGYVTVKVRNRKKRVGLVGGTAQASFIGFTRGAYRVVVKYHGDDLMLSSKAVDTVNVR